MATAPIRWYLRRREIRNLDDLDDQMLDDLGLTRSDVRWAMQMPLAENAALALERRRWERRHGIR